MWLPGSPGEQGPPGEMGISGMQGEKGPLGMQGMPGGGAIYTRWGQTACPADQGTELVYVGRAGGTRSITIVRGSDTGN